VCSLAATLAPSFELLVALRVGQAAAGAALIPNGMAMLRAAVPVRRLGRINGMFGSAVAVSAASGPLVGAALLEASSWRLLFLLNVPVVALALLLHSRLRHVDERTSDRAEIDWAGGALMAAILIGVTWLLASLDGSAGVASTAGVLAAVLVAGLAFVRRQMVVRVAVVPWRLFRRRSFAAASVYIMVSNLVMYTSLLTIPFFIREVQDGGPARIGLLLGAMSFLMAALAPASGHLSDALGRRLPALAGATLGLGGSLLLVGGIGSDVSFAYLAVALALLGSGIGLGSGAATTAAIEAAPRALAGSAAGTNSMMRYVGSIVGAGVLAGLLGSGEPAPSVEVFRAVFAVVAAMALVTVLAASAIHVRVAEDTN
jgi:DHA2 family methylenomycin A resistance protein-like MFS transporter